MKLSRRTALGAGLGTAVGALAGSSSSFGAGLSGVLTNPAGPRPRPSLPIGEDLIPEIEHIVVVMMENHSFDNLLGASGHGDGLTFLNGVAQNTNPDGLGGQQNSYRLPTTCQLDTVPWQSWSQSWKQFLGTQWQTATRAVGTNQGFVISNSGPDAMGYHTPDQMPFINSLAQTFPLANRWFASCLAMTYPNRMFMMGSTSLGITSSEYPSTTPPNGTIFQAMHKYGISWKNYWSSAPSSWIWAPLASKPWFQEATLNSRIDQFFVDAKNGTLPAFSLVDPDFNSEAEENPNDAQHGDAFLWKIVNAVMSGKNWKKTMLVWLYDEHGGYYDHVIPPAAPAPDNSTARIMASDPWLGRAAVPSFGQLGFRVPAGVVSPYAKPNGYVSDTTYDHTSIIRLVREKWNLPAFTPRDKWAASPLDMLNLQAPPAFATPPTLAGQPRDTMGALVATNLPGDSGQTADERKYPDDNRLIPGKGYLNRRQFYVTKSGQDTTIETPLYKALSHAWMAARVGP